MDITKLFPPSEVSPSPIVDTHPVFDLEEITEVEVKNIISGLRSSKARDADDLDTNFIKTHIDGLIEPTTMLVNESISAREVPSSWKVATVTQIFKSGDKAMMSNYRPISIPPCVSKVAEKWVSKLITKHLAGMKTGQG